MASPRLPVPSLAVVALLLLALCGQGARARPPPPLHGVRPLAFDEGYTQIFGSANLALLRGGRRVRLTLDETTVSTEHGAVSFFFSLPDFLAAACLPLMNVVNPPATAPVLLVFLLSDSDAGAGFASQDLFLHGFFSAAIKLPADYAAGVVVAFYLSNGDVYEKTHDELDFEFLGNVRGREWRVQTNVYGNGSTHAGREERYDLPFDPTDDFHHYSILWTSQRIIFYVDETPIREVVRAPAMGAAFPSKPMSLYATIWDGSAWATLGGRYRVNYKYAPFAADFADLLIRACAVDPAADPRSAATCAAGGGAADLLLEPLAGEQRAAMAAFRRAHTSYSYCHDRRRYPVALAECAAGQRLLPARMFGPDGMKRHRRRRGGAGGRRGAQDDVM
ncbi:hypothetical protein U9M48_014334 [Paspalum notatum var. saurae]|uniref:Xyloglucan endotransglucosylase/hydrolase n=1 Tax=Paspalum notatum var. saurae TaxID=547442 RepID=A0AAQ3T1U9_PASNO